MKSRHSEGSISRYTFVEKFGRSLYRNYHLSICSSKVCLTSGRFPEIEHFWVRGGKLDFVETMDRRDRLLLLSISRLSTFFNNLSSFLLSRCYDSSQSVEGGVDNLNWYFSFFLELVDLFYSITFHAFVTKFQLDFIIIHRIPHSF